MIREGIKAIREITDFWLHDLLTPAKYGNTIKSMKSAKFLGEQKHRGFDYSKTYSAGDFCWIEYGNNLEPELSFEHIGLIFMKKGKMFYTIPLTTPKTWNPKHMNAYHPVSNPLGNEEFVLLKKLDFPFLAHDSVAKTSEIKIVSQKRIKGKIGRVSINTPLVSDIIRIAHKYTFNDYDYEIAKLKKEVSLLKMQLFLANLNQKYEVSDFTELEFKLPIPPMYSVSPVVPIEIQPGNFEYNLELKDQYGQTASRKITYTIK